MTSEEQERPRLVTGSIGVNGLKTVWDFSCETADSQGKTQVVPITVLITEDAS